MCFRWNPRFIRFLSRKRKYKIKRVYQKPNFCVDRFDIKNERFSFSTGCRVRRIKSKGDVVEREHSAFQFHCLVSSFPIRIPVPYSFASPFVHVVGHLSFDQFRLIFWSALIQFRTIFRGWSVWEMTVKSSKINSILPTKRKRRKNEKKLLKKYFWLRPSL